MQTDFTNEEAVGYLADRLARLGVEEALAKAGANSSDTVLIGDPDDAVVFDWDPDLTAGGGTHVAGPGAPTDACNDDHARRPGRAKRTDVAPDGAGLKWHWGGRHWVGRH